MVNISTNINKTNNHLSLQIIEYEMNPPHMTLEIHVMTKDRHIYVAQLNRFMGSQPDRQ